MSRTLALAYGVACYLAFLAVPRAAPCPIGLDAVVALLHDATPATARVGGVGWPGRSIVAFPDDRCAVRLRLRSEAVSREAGIGEGLEELPEPVQGLLHAALAPAA